MKRVMIFGLSLIIAGLFLIVLGSVRIDAREMSAEAALKNAKALYGPSAILRQELDTGDYGKWRKQILVESFGFGRRVYGEGHTWNQAFADALAHGNSLMAAPIQSTGK